MSQTNGVGDQYAGRSLNELLLTRSALGAEIAAIDAAIVQAANAQRRELDRALEIVGGTTTRSKRSAESRARYSAAAKARWAAARAAGLNPTNLPPKPEMVGA